MAATDEARKVAEGARQTEWAGATFVRDLMNGRFRLPLVPFLAILAAAGIEQLASRRAH